MIFDRLKNKLSRADAPARKSSDITPDDDNDLAVVSRSIYVGVSGDLAVHMADSDSIQIYKSVPIGFIPIQAKRVLATGTTAAFLVSVW